MSAYLCSAELISSIVSAADGDAGQFRKLVKENLRSLEARYPGRDFLRDWKREAKAYVYTPVALSPTQVIMNCNCFDYQACETDDYESTWAAGYVAGVRERMLARGGKASGEEFNAAQWGM